MVARGRAVWIAGFKRIRETRPSQARGELRVWRKTRCYDPELGVSIYTMQFVNPDDAPVEHSYSTPNNKSNRKRLKSDPRPAA